MTLLTTNEPAVLDHIATARRALAATGLIRFDPRASRYVADRDCDEARAQAAAYNALASLREVTK